MNANWKQLFEEYKPGDKVKSLINNNFFKYGQIYTLNFCYIKKGVWLKYFVGDKNSDKDTFWMTKENKHQGIEENDFERVH